MKHVRQILDMEAAKTRSEDPASLKRNEAIYKNTQWDGDYPKVPPTLLDSQGGDGWSWTDSQSWDHSQWYSYHSNYNKWHRDYDGVA